MFFELAVLTAIGAGISWLNSSTPTPARNAAALREGGATPQAPMTDSMDGHVIAASLPTTATTARENALLGLAATGQIPAPTLTSVTYTKGGHTVEIFPATDALMLGTENPVRLNARHTTAQQLADFFGMTLPTSLMSDQAWLAATQISPQDGLSGPHMADTATMIQESDLVDAAFAKAGIPAGSFVRPTGKDWVNTERLLQPDGSITRAVESPTQPAAANFGWHKKGATLRSPGGQPVLQSVGLVHDGTVHVDYSQVVTLYGPTAVIDGDSAHPQFIVDILADPQQAYLLSDEVKQGTAARVSRYPLVPLDIA